MVPATNCPVMSFYRTCLARPGLLALRTRVLLNQYFIPYLE